MLLLHENQRKGSVRQNMPDLRGDEMKGSTRWGLVTFALGVTCGTLGHYLPVEAASFAVVIMSFFFGLFGKASIEDRD